MDASEDHMLNSNAPKRKMHATILDSFTSLSKNNEKARIEAGVKLLEHLHQKQSSHQESGLCPELQYALERLVRGIASSRASSRAGYFSTLVGLMSTFPTVLPHWVLNAVQKELHVSCNSKSEEADVLMGQILVFGALVESNRMSEVPDEEVGKLVQLLWEAGAKRSYLRVLSHTFVMKMLHKVNEECFRDSVWPQVKERVTQWPEQTLEVLHILLWARNRYPSVVKKKFLSSHLGTPEVLDEGAIEHWAKLLMTIRHISDLYHPIYEELCMQLVESPLLVQFWEAVVDHSLEKPSDSKRYLLMEMFHKMLQFSKDRSEIPLLLTPKFVDAIVKSLEKLAYRQLSKTDVSCAHTQLTVNYMVTTALKEVKGKTLLKIIKHLVFKAGGELMFDRITGTRVIHNLISQLKSHHAKSLAALFWDVVCCVSSKPGGVDGEEPRQWNNKERMYACDMFVKIVGTPSLVTDVEWRTDQAKLLLQYSIFTPTSSDNIPVGNVLADTLKAGLLRVLNQRLPKMEDVRQLLRTLVHHVHSLLEGRDFLPRQSLTKETMDTWQQMMSTEESMQSATQEQSLTRVFHTMILYMGLQLLVDPNLATDALNELYSCYQHVQLERKDTESDDPGWVEVSVDLILSLLSGTSSIPKNMVDMFFFHLCPHLTESAIKQILQVLDPNAEENPLGGSDDDDDDDDDDDEDDQGDDDDKNANREDKSSESSSESAISDLEDAENDTVNDKLRMAVRDALGTAAPLTDTESVDIDEMDEEEGKRLDAALSQAFSMLKKTKKDQKSRKQPKDERLLMHFRIRVVDLLEMYLKSEHAGTETALSTYLDIMLVLFDVLEFCIKDVHQKPLENKTRSCLKKLASHRKNLSLEGVTDETIAEAIEKLLRKGEKTTGAIVIDMGPKLVECCTFLVRCAQQLEDSSLVENIYKDALANFFTKRECLHQPALFRSVLQSTWTGNWSLAPLLVKYAFDKNVRPFRRSQALEFLVVLCRNRRLTSQAHLAQLEHTVSNKIIKWLHKEDKVKPKFMKQLVQVLATLRKRSKDTGTDSGIDWDTIRSTLTQADMSADKQMCFNRLATLLNVKWSPATQETKQSSSAEESATDSEAEQPNNKQKKKKKKNKDIAKLKKESKQRRLASLSEGLEELQFSGLQDDNTDIEQEPQQLNGHVNKRKLNNVDNSKRKKTKLDDSS